MNDVNVVITYVMYYYTYICHVHTYCTYMVHMYTCNIRTCKNYHQLHVVPFLQQDITVYMYQFLR